MTKFTFFWGGPFSQWYKSSMVIHGITYNCAEQFMMAEKARLFNDKETELKILAEQNPRDQKAYGRQVKGFDIPLWEKNAKLVVYRGNRAKFTQDKVLHDALMKTNGTTLVEASPVDQIWGIGLAENDPRAIDQSQWRGLNWLGEIITQVREDLN